ncbi:putative calcium-binding outer membrane-like protein, partial [Vibrio parahaemolyticus V-223/04]
PPLAMKPIRVRKIRSPSP